MARRLLLLAVAVLLVFGVAGPADGKPPPGPGPALKPKPGRTDAELYAKAKRIQARMWKHISREGVLVYRHRRDATPDELSHDALKLADAAIWTGCYAAAQACRWHVTRDPDALAQVRVLARGLALMTDATGVPGCLARTVGRPLPGEPETKRMTMSPNIAGLAFRGDVSRDQLAGWTLGWALIAKYVEDPDVQALARRQLDELCDRLKTNGMKLRDHEGKRTKYGDLTLELEGLPLVKNGVNAAIGYAPFVVGAQIGGNDTTRKHARRLQKKGYREALAAQHAGLGLHLKATNVFMTDIALAAIRVWAVDDKSRRYSKDAMRQLRQRTRGWWNAGFCACQLIGGLNRGRPQIVDEARVTLHVMSEDEIPPAKTVERSLNRAATVKERGTNTSWSWKSGADLVREPIPGSGPHPDKTYTRADWLFAYWLARAAGELTPESGPGAKPPPVMFGIKTPAWAYEVPLTEIGRK